MAADGIVWDDAPAPAPGIRWDDEEEKKKKAAAAAAPAPKQQSATERLIEESFAPTEVAASLATGAVAPAIGGWAGIAGSILPGPEGQGAAWSQKVTDALTYEPKGKTAQGVMHVVNIPGELLAKGANWAGEKTTDITGSPLAGTAVNTGIQSLPLIFGTKAVTGKLLPEGEFIGTAAKREAARVANLQRDTAAIAAQDAGFKLPPSQVNPPSLTSPSTWSLGEATGGKIKTAQKLSLDNQIKAQEKIRADFNLPEDTPLNADTFDSIRRQAGTKYDAARRTGESPTSAQYVADLGTMDAPIRKTMAAYPLDPPPPILEKIKALMVPTLDADAAVSKIKDLRAEARKAGSGPTPDKHYASQLQYLADTVEGELERHLERTGQPPNVLKDFQDARKTIAKAYTAEKYVTPAGEVNAPAMARELRKGTPLEGGMRDVAEFGANFPKAAQLPSKIGGVPIMSPLDMAAAVISPTTHLPFAVGNVIGRSLGRSLVGSKWYQDRFVNPPSYGRSLGARLVGDVLQNPRVGAVSMDLTTEAERKRRLAEMLKGR